LKIQSIDYGDHWEALINDGWWIGRGETKQKAIDSAIKRMNDELNRYGCGVKLRPADEYIQEKMF